MNSKYIRWMIPSVILFLISSFENIGYSQDENVKHQTFMGLEYQQSGTQKKLIAQLTARIEGERGRKRIDGAEIEFYNILDTAQILLGKINTNVDGIATLEIPQNVKLNINASGQYAYSVTFNGNDAFRDASAELAIKPISLEISFIEIDSVKNIVATAFHWEEGEKIPVEEEVLFYVPSQFSRLKIGEVDLEDGEGMIPFPVTLPGDSIGNLRIIARIEESDDFGTIETLSVIDWGQPRTPVIIETRRGLGDTDAPLWMVYTLIILLGTVWFHYLYLFYVLFDIKIKGKKEQSIA